MKYDLKRDGITQSLLTTFMVCPRAGLLSVDGWEKNSLINVTRFGSLVHEALDQLYRGVNIYEALEVSSAKYLKKHEDIMTTKDLEMFELDMAQIEVLLPVYIDYYSGDFTGKAFTGNEFVADVVWNGYRLRGKIDGIYRDKNGEEWLMEHKTKSRISPDKLMEGLHRDFQNLFYITLFEAMYPDRKINGVLYNIMRNPSSKPLKNETIVDYKLKIGKQAKKSPDYFFMRYELHYGERDRHDFQQELLYKLAGVERLLRGRSMDYHNEAYCRNCDYPALCLCGDESGYRKSKLFNELED